MPSNRELIEQIGALSQRLGVSVETHGLNNQALVQLAADLKTRSDPEAISLPVAVQIPPPESPRKPEVTYDILRGAQVGGRAAPENTSGGPFQYAIAAGKAITSARGVLGPGDEVKPSDFSGGVEQIEELVSLGYINKNG